MRSAVVFLLLLLPTLVPGQIIVTVAGNGNGGYNGDNIPATTATIGFFGDIAVDKKGNIFIADANNNRVRKVNAITGIITTFAGNGTQGFSGDNGSATQAQFNNIQSLTFDNYGDLYITDNGNQRVRKVNVLTGIVTTVAGNGLQGFSGDNGPATAASFAGCLQVAFDKANNMYIADNGNQRIRKVNTNGIISTLVGIGTAGDSGDGGLATNAEIYYPFAIDIDSNDNLFISDIANSKIRKVDLATNIISTFAGDGLGIYNGDGILGINAGISPWGIAFDKWNNLYVADYGNDRIRRVDGVTGIITTVAGIGVQGFSGDDSLAVNAKINHPEGVEVDTCGNLYIADYGNRRVRKVTFFDCENVGVLAFANDETFKILPNPVINYIAIAGKNIQIISITNTLGQIVYWQKVSEEKTIVDMSSLHTGMYFVTVTDRQGMKMSKKVIKE